MYRLLDFFYQYRAFLFFVFLETICIWLIVKTNSYQGAAFFNSSNRYVGNILEVKTNIQDYFSLKRVNEEVTNENARLKEQLSYYQLKPDSTALPMPEYLRSNRYEYIAAKVINNSTAHYNNFITLDKGTLDGLRVGMGITSPKGVVGRINHCSDHFSTAFSILSKNLTWSAKVKTKGIECNVVWDGESPNEADLKDITRHQKIAVGDTIITSGYNTFFPEGIMMGKIKEFSLEGGSFWSARIELSTDFNALSYVYVIGNKMEAEQDSLEIKNQTEMRP